MLEYIDRKGSDCYKWDSECAQGTIPLWVADMDFAAAKPIREAMQRRLEHGVFGYSIVPQANYDAVANWFSRRHGWKGINRNNLLYTTAVVPAVSAIFKALQLQKHKSQTKPNRLRVLTFTPAYNCFFSCIENMGCELIPSALVVHNNRYEIDWTDVEQNLPFPYPPIFASNPCVCMMLRAFCCVSSEGASISMPSGLYVVPSRACFPLPTS